MFDVDESASAPVDNDGAEDEDRVPGLGEAQAGEVTEQGPVIGQVGGFVWRLDRLGRSLPDRSRYPQISRLSGSDAPDKRLQRGHSLLTQLDRVVGLARRGGGFLENAVGMEQERLLVREAIGPEVRQSDGELI